jgi:hypothetical protein
VLTIQQLEPNNDKDQWHYSWGNSNFSASKAYKQKSWVIGQFTQSSSGFGVK